MCVRVGVCVVLYLGEYFLLLQSDACATSALGLVGANAVFASFVFWVRCVMGAVCWHGWSWVEEMPIIESQLVL